MRYLADDVGLLLVAVGFLFLLPGAACTIQSLDPLVQSCAPGIACGLRDLFQQGGLVGLALGVSLLATGSWRLWRRRGR